MGAATRHRQKFLKEHSVCAFCGAKATSIEHCPPRAMFQFRQWPEGFEFPSCEACNQGTANHDLLIAMIARMDPIADQGNLDGKLAGIMKNASKQHPELFKKMMPSANEARQHNREFRLQPNTGQTHQEVSSAVKIPNELHDAVCIFARKLAKSIFYQETQTPFPANGCLISNWFTNAQLLSTGKYLVFDILKELGGLAPALQRTGKYLNNQFEYKLSLSTEKDILVLQARFGNSFGFVVFGCTIEGKLESMVNKLREQTKENGPFAILQSTTLS